MPEKRTIRKAQKMKQEGKSPSTQAGAFAQEEVRHVREGKHGAKNPKKASLHEASMKSIKSKGKSGLSRAAKKGAKTRMAQQKAA